MMYSLDCSFKEQKLIDNWFNVF